MPKNIAVLLIIAYLIIYSSVGAASDFRYEPGELIVRFSPKSTGEQRTITERNAILDLIGGGEVKDSSRFVPGLTLVKLPAGLTVKDALKTFNRTDGILHAQPNYIYKALSTFPNDPRFNELWGMHNTGQSGGTVDADIDAPQAWDITTDSDIIVAVIDSGIDYTHPDLAANMWVNPGEIPGDGIDNDHNGYVDDVYGWDFYDDVNDPMDDFGHGTHCAGTIGAIGNNGEGVTGTCWNVKLMAIKFLDSYGGGNTWDAVESIKYAIKMGAKVLNNSWGGSDDDPDLEDAIEAADANGVLFVAAAGNPYDWEDPNNDSSPRYPASYDCNNIISVMATDHSDLRSIWYGRSSAYGATSVDLGAPGSDILSCKPGGGYQYMSGTSMATPHVAGVCALVWSMNRTLSYLQVKDIILNSVDQKQALNGLCVTGGRLNLYNAVANTPRPTLDKVDVNEPNSVLPYDEITYIIYYANPPVGDPHYVGTLTDVNIVDYLPEEVDAINSFDPNYNSSAHTYTWNIGTLLPGGSNSITIKVTVNELAEPLGTITNKTVMTTNIGKVTATEITDVNSWNPPFIYVDKRAGGSNNGMSWKNAYRDLQKALAKARAGCGSQIWVAAGTYKPTTEPNSLATFQLVSGVPIYGGFPSGGGLRNWMTNETILDGQNGVSHVVTGNGIEDAIIDGFTIRGSYGGYGTGVSLDDANVTIVNCRLKENSGSGIYIGNNSHPYIHNCLFEDNSDCAISCGYSEPVITNSTLDGNNITPKAIYAEVSNVKLANCIVKKHTYGIEVYDSTLNLTNSVICFNGGCGIYLQDIYYWIPSSATIKNNWIYNNSSNGICSYNVNTALEIRNNTIVNNGGYGIDCSSSTAPDISNCILWGNNSEGDQLSANCTASYSCIQNGDTNNHNIVANPLFYDPNDPNNLHLASNSPCIDTGDPNVNYDGETDIDGQPRRMDPNGQTRPDSMVDRGADEYYFHLGDFNGDGIVNFIDYALFADAWQNQSSSRSLDGDSDVDIYDLKLFCEDWLWQAGWAKSFACGAGEGMSQAMAAVLASTVGAAGETSSQSTSAEQQIEKVEPVKIEQLIKWLDEIWLDPEVRQVIDKDTWLKFMESVASELK